MRRDESVFLIGEDIGIEGGFGGAFGVYLGLPEEFGHDRIVDTPISEKAIAGAAVGAALLGMRPIADMQYSDFLFECMDELVNQAAKMRYMSGGKVCGAARDARPGRRDAAAARSTARARRATSSTCRGSRSSASPTPTTRRGC